MKKLVVLGAGRVGSAIVSDLCYQYNVTVVDIDSDRLDFLEKQYSVHTILADISNTGILQKIINDTDLVIGAMPGYLGFETLKNVISSGKNIVDISFFSEDPFGLDTLAKDFNVTAVVDCGIAPGMSNIILGYHNQRMDIEHFECIVGGLPVKRSWPYQYKATFSPLDVIEEYTRPARIVENGIVVTKLALSEAEYVEISPIGTLEAFNTDGLRTLLKTMKIPNMKEKTLRYPGHIEYIQVLRESGFFDKNSIQINETSIRPIDMTAKLLSAKWMLEKDEPDFTIMQITIIGKEQRKNKQYIYSMIDHFDQKAKISSMARTTGYVCTAVARLVLNADFTQKGICPPEFIGRKPECFKKIMSYLKERNVNYIIEEKIVNDI